LKRQHDEESDTEVITSIERRASLASQHQQSQHQQRQPDILYEPRPGYIQMAVNGKAVSMRKADYMLNATQILQLSRLTKSKREGLLRLLQRKAEYEVDYVALEAPYGATWVCYSHGHLLCQALDLEVTLYALLEYRNGTTAFKTFPPGPNCYFDRLCPEFIDVDAGNRTVAIRRQEFLVNASDILKATGRDTNLVDQARIRRIQRYSHKGPKHSGTYVMLLDALKLCSDFRFIELRDLLQRTADKWEGVPCQPQAEVDSGMDTSDAEDSDSADVASPTQSMTSAGSSQGVTYARGIDDLVRDSQTSFGTYTRLRKK
jgi:hypothetical protein